MYVTYFFLQIRKQGSTTLAVSFNPHHPPSPLPQLPPTTTIHQPTTIDSAPLAYYTHNSLGRMVVSEHVAPST